jgi:hypothetical protein
VKLEYIILWLENDKETITLKSPEIKKHLTDLNFEVNVIEREDDSDTINILKTSDVNLILVDYNLQEQLKGDNIINAIRQNQLYNEVVFYSAGSFRDKIKPQLEGVFYANIDNLVEKTKAIIDITLKKNQDISNIRGLFVAETTDLTKQMEEVIIKILKIKEEPLKFFNSQVIQEEFFSDYAKYKIIKRFLDQKNTILKEKILSTAEPELTSLKSLQKQVDDIYKDFSHYQQEVIELRNELAHCKKSEKGRHILCVHNKISGSFEDKNYDEKMCSQIRKNFLKQSQRLNEIMKLIDELMKIQPQQKTQVTQIEVTAADTVQYSKKNKLRAQHLLK